MTRRPAPPSRLSSTRQASGDGLKIEECVEAWGDLSNRRTVGSVIVTGAGLAEVGLEDEAAVGDVMFAFSQAVE